MIGEIADDLITEGMIMWQMHIGGHCDELENCQYCEDEQDG